MKKNLLAILIGLFSINTFAVESIGDLMERYDLSCGIKYENKVQIRINKDDRHELILPNEVITYGTKVISGNVIEYGFMSRLVIGFSEIEKVDYCSDTRSKLKTAEERTESLRLSDKIESEIGDDSSVFSVKYKVPAMLHDGFSIEAVLNCYFLERE